MTDIKAHTRDELLASFQAWQQPAYRVAQLLQWLYVRRVTSWDTMTNLPKALRELLAREFALGTPALVREQGPPDATRKFLWRLGDGAFIESVLIPANPALYGEASDRHTLCVSTQVGCAYGCKFCASGLDGWKRHLTPDEIVEQVLAVERSFKFQVSSVQPGAGVALETENLKLETPSRPPRFVDNVVVMGMGEPLANYDNVLKALRILNAPWGGGIGARKITLSTSGLAPQIRRLADEPEQFRLAVSLHGATDAVRDQIMPVNRKHPLRELVAACEHYLQRKGRMITLEYILIAGLNDGLDQTGALAQLALRLHAKVNLIPYNTVPGLPWQRPTEEVQESFLAALEKRKVIATLRREKGGDIAAACGQLRLQTEAEADGKTELLS
jgi:23S rRNA (adenine2503-C2)-methyltransferase